MMECLRTSFWMWTLCHTQIKSLKHLRNCRKLWEPEKTLVRLSTECKYSSNPTLDVWGRSIHAVDYVFMTYGNHRSPGSYDTERWVSQGHLLCGRKTSRKAKGWNSSQRLGQEPSRHGGKHNRSPNNRRIRVDRHPIIVGWPKRDGLCHSFANPVLTAALRIT